MKIDLYTRCWNDAHMLPFFFRHYDNLVDKYVVFDDGSTDNSAQLLRANPKVDLRPMPPYSDPDSRVASGMLVLESCWKESRGAADWVIVTDIDEHLHHADLIGYLGRCQRRGITIIPALGYQMLSDDFPAQDVRLNEALTKGAPFHMMNKLNLFAPDYIEATNFHPGRHVAEPTGHVVAPARDELFLLHYRYLGFENTFRRSQAAWSRQRAKDLSKGWGREYAWTREQLRADWEQVEQQLVDISAPDLRAWKNHHGPRWWHDKPSVARVKVRRWINIPPLRSLFASGRRRP